MAHILKEHPVVVILTDCEMAWSVSKEQARQRANILAVALLQAGVITGEVCGGRVFLSVREKPAPGQRANLK